ncbi:cytochrome c3 family protein [Shewanella sp. CG12_big_fil_rev_8_21_14_0_65_47_15]|uniref:cytochrome c3 family protein n=1 Tax=Shewanella sp. CG12_big_fil_rev_8_21_14_0_65_47_15 TaxID=1975537 RepID=UPI000CADD6A1|nr:cytochrome c3 family protein [Shewanella sp. CG12_big_fil_rev_8_21_14_0_65_47_15]PIW59483.1 MAG: hypothetical protein COW15_17790 [Shewanella sp. CG12_big_fil_rev_8_21_14_0_65_47_15]
MIAILKIFHLTKLKKIEMNASCISCHSTVPSEKTVDVTFHHEFYQGVKVSINPHYAHIGKIRCVLCHSGHEEPNLYCNNCHEFDVNVPDISK